MKKKPSQNKQPFLCEQTKGGEENIMSVLHNICGVVLSVSWPRMDKVLFVSPAVESFLGYSPEVFKKKPGLWFELIHQDDRESVDLILAKIEKDRCVEMEYRVIRNDGTLKWVNDRRYLVSDHEGLPVRLDGMMVDITERKLSECRLQNNFSFQSIISEIATKFVKTTKESVDDDINFMLSRIGKLFQVDRSYLYAFSDDQEFMTNTHAWCRGGVGPQKTNLQHLPSKKFSWWSEKILSGEHIHIPDNEALTGEAGAIKDLLRKQSIKSLLCIPVRSAGRVLGFLGLDSVLKHHTYDASEIDNLQIVANIIGDFLLKQHTEQELLETKKLAEENEERFRQISENTGEVFWLRSADNSQMLYINRAYERVWGLSCQSLYDDPDSFMDAVHELDRPILISELEKYMTTGKFDLEYRIYHADGSTRWVRAQHFPVKDENGEVKIGRAHV